MLSAHLIVDCCGNHTLPDTDPVYADMVITRSLRHSPANLLLQHPHRER